MSNYYSDRLNANNLLRCYEIAPKRIKQFLEAEIDYVLSKIKPGDKVLDLGCGYGRVAIRLAERAKWVYGIDISSENIRLARDLSKNDAIRYFLMNAIALDFPDETFDVTLCVQNGISAFHEDPFVLITEALRVTKKSGLALFSSYSDKIWKPRLEWFEIQSKQGLIGDIDYELTKNGTIVCKDGFKAITYSADEFQQLASNFKVKSKVLEVDDSCIFCVMLKDS